MSSPLNTQTITCKVCCYSTTVMITDSDEPLPVCQRCGAQRWDTSAIQKIKRLNPISYIKNLLHTKLF